MSVGWLAVRKWWREPADYRWLLATLRRHSVFGVMQLVMGTTGLGLSVVAVMLLLSSEGPQDVTGRLTIEIVAVLSVLLTLRWYVLPWPTASVSLAQIAVSDIAITAICQAVNPRVGMIYVTTLILTGGYLTLFHSAKALAAHAGWSLLSVLTVTMRMVLDTERDSDIPLAVALTLIMTLAVVFVLPTLHFFYWVLRTDALSDPLTNLWNRRGLDYYLPALFEAAGPICAMVIDLDRFKVVNDNFGHQEGDRVLVRAAARLRDTAGPAATVARTGGEEFTLVDHLDAVSARSLAERLRRAIAGSNGATAAITASIGVAVFDPGTVADGRPAPEQLLDYADTAMYRAKERGGNTIFVRELREPLV
ncbi:GGDEF domain-containing protein [Nocardia vaccinii]|uniref:GGDEF domain-containing protein n=1 Tax=Nocardia vaccinii TaxID=1822 RepID=UPI00082C0182|nr:GGDEF domain-containing protein [Nocardia vaccinii]